MIGVRNPALGRKPPKVPEEQDPVIRAGDYVLMIGQETPGEVLQLKGSKATVAFGSVRTVVSTGVLEKISREKYRKMDRPVYKASQTDDWTSGVRKLNFSPNIDLRGKRADEAISMLTDFVDQAVMVQARHLRILHGKGNGILRELVRQYLSAIDVVKSYADENVERGGAGITIVELDI